MKERHEHIEAYVSGQMTAEEVASFQQELERDQELALAVKAYQEIDNALADANLNAFVGMLEEANQKHQSDQQTVLNPSISWWTSVGGRLAIAASVSVVVLFAYFFWPNRAADPQEWFDQNFEPYNYQSQRSSDDRYPADLTIALELYQNGNYKEAIVGLEPRIDDFEYQITASFYLAQALLADGQTDRAIASLTHQLSGRSTVFDQTNEWCLALAYLKQNRITEARDMALQIIAISGHSYATQAEELLKTFPE